MGFDKINGNLGNVNGFLFGKKVGKEEAAKAEAKKDVPVGQPQAAAETANIDKTNLNLDMNAIMGLHLTKQAGKVDTSEQATLARMERAFTQEPESYRLKQEFGIPAEIEGLDDDIAAFLPAKALAYIAKATPEIKERIGAASVNEFDRMVAMA